MKLRAIQQNNSLSDTEKSISLVSIVKNIDAGELRKMPMGKVEKVMQETTAELESISTMEIKKIQLKDQYVIGDITCRLMRTVNMMTASQFSDLINTINSGVDENLHTILSILLVPVGKRYPDYNRHELEEKILSDFELSDGMAIANFCRGLSLVSHANILTSLTLNRVTGWTAVPRWRRTLVRMVLNTLLMPSKRLLRKNGVL